MELRQKRVDAIAQEFAPDQWFRLSAGSGMKGPRFYDWAAGAFGALTEDGLRRWVLFRRSVEKPEEIAYYLCLTPAEATLAEAAGQRWNIECCFEAAKQETGLDEYEARSRDGWYRHITLSMLALTFLSVVRAKGSGNRRGKKKGGEVIPLTEPKIRKLLCLIVWPRLRDVEKALFCSHWRRRHQAAARRCHY